MGSPTPRFYEFPPFLLDARQRVLLKSGEMVPLTPKVFDTLLALVESAGRDVEKEELMRRLWPDTVVEEANLTQHVSVLRRALGDTPGHHRFIATLPGRGYRFVGGVRSLGTEGAGAVPEAPPPAEALPATTTALIGREAEVARLASLFRGAGPRLLTLTGAGGSGKTRLAVEVADGLLAELEGGVIFVPLVSVRDPGLVASALAQAVGAREAGGKPLVEALKARLQERQLLVLDNFEQVLDAAPLVAELLMACPRLKILVTSRALLHLTGELEFPVPPLALPGPEQLRSPEALAGCPSVALFLERARAADGDFALHAGNAAAVAEICARLDGLPLAIELAAARTRVLSPPAMLERMQSRLRLLTGGARDLHERHQTMRGAIAWSYDLLDPGARALFRRLAVFVGGWTLEAAEAVCPRGGDLGAVVDGLTSLLDQGLLVRPRGRSGDRRFTMLETFREFALERLDAEGETAEVSRRHAVFFLELAERAEPELLGGGQGPWLERLEEEHDNLRVTLDRLALGGEAHTALRVAVALWHFWKIRGHWSEGRRRLAWLLAAAGGSAPATLQTKALYAAGVLADEQGDYAGARRLFDQKLALQRQLGDRWGIANALNNLGVAALRQGDHAGARSLYEESLALWRELGNRVAIALTLDNLGNLAAAQSDHASARAYHEESLAIFRELGNQEGVAWSLSHLGDVARAQDDRAAARGLYEESAAIFRTLGHEPGIVSVLADLATVARAGGDVPAAEVFCREALAKAKELGDRRATARLLESFAELAAMGGGHERALRLGAAAFVVRADLGAALSGAEQRALEARRSAARNALGEEAAAAAWNEGQVMSLEDAIEYALRPP